MSLSRSFFSHTWRGDGIVEHFMNTLQLLAKQRRLESLMTQSSCNFLSCTNVTWKIPSQKRYLSLSRVITFPSGFVKRHRFWMTWKFIWDWILDYCLFLFEVTAKCEKAVVAKGTWLCNQTLLWSHQRSTDNQNSWYLSENLVSSCKLKPRCSYSFSMACAMSLYYLNKQQRICLPATYLQSSTSMSYCMTFINRNLES